MWEFVTHYKKEGNIRIVKTKNTILGHNGMDKIIVGQTGIRQNGMEKMVRIKSSLNFSAADNMIFVVINHASNLTSLDFLCLCITYL